jgi:hypothetical protein
VRDHRGAARRELVRLSALRPDLVERIHVDHPGLHEDALVGRAEVERYRTLYVEEMLKTERGDLSALDKQVAESLAKHETLAEDIQEEYEEKRTIGERLSDRLASFGGSWAFLISFAVVLAVWIALNVALGEARAFDVYPFILLNLILSCLAAIQAPIIMMSQRRQDRGPAALPERLSRQPQGRAGVGSLRKIRPPDLDTNGTASRDQAMQLEIGRNGGATSARAQMGRRGGWGDARRPVACPLLSEWLLQTAGQTTASGGPSPDRVL